MTTDDLLVEHVVDVAERLEELESIEEMDWLEVKVEATFQSSGPQPTAFVYVLTTGGPHVELRVSGSSPTTVQGWWGGSEHSTHMRNRVLLDQLWSLAYEQWEASR